MGRSLSLYWAHPIAEADILATLTALGGVVLDREDLDVGVSRGDARVWIYHLRAALAGHFETPSDSVRAKLGLPPRLVISINLSHHPDSSALALGVARALLEQWPGVAEGALYSALSLCDAEQRLSAILGGCVFFAMASEPRLAEALEECAGFSVDSSDSEMIQSLGTELQAVRDTVGRGFFDPVQDKIVGVLPMGAKHSWVLRTPAAQWLASSAPADRKVTEVASGILGQQPSSLVQLVLGATDDEGEAERQSIALFRAVSRTQPAAMFGLFSLFLDHDDIARMLENGDVDLR